jgi:acetate kinase
MGMAGLMRVLVVNTGSSSLKLRVVGAAWTVEASRDVQGWNGQGSADELTAFFERVAVCDAVGHRVVHGGPGHNGPVVLDESIIDELAALEPLAPGHQARAVDAIRAVTAVCPQVPAVGCFDTAFHARLPAAAATYAVPREWRERWALRRYGFHGLSHAWASRRAAAMLRREDDARLRLVICHLGAGSSLCAVQGGRSIDTTMGLTPLEGLVMATRSGSVDPGLVLWLTREGGLSPDAVQRGLEEQAGLAGLSPSTGPDGDMRRVLDAAHGGDSGAELALDVWMHSLRRHVGAMVAALDGVDAIVFTGGIGEHQPELRAQLVAGLSYLGAEVDGQANAAVRGDADVSGSSATCRVLVVAAREELEIARQVRDLLVDTPSASSAAGAS